MKHRLNIANGYSLEVDIPDKYPAEQILQHPSVQRCILALKKAWDHTEETRASMRAVPSILEAGRTNYPYQRARKVASYHTDTLNAWEKAEERLYSAVRHAVRTYRAAQGDAFKLQEKVDQCRAWYEAAKRGDSGLSSMIDVIERKLKEAERKLAKLKEGESA